MSERDRPDAYAIARISIDAVIPVTCDPEERRIGGKLHTIPGKVVWDAGAVLSMVMDAQEALDDGGYGSTIVDGRVERVCFTQLGAPIDLNLESHRVEEPDDAG